MFSYIIQPGDTLWGLAQRYNTSVDKINSLNPGLTPYNLYAGLIISIPLSPAYRSKPHKNKCGKNCFSKAELDLKTNMRVLWEEHVAWTRMAIISITFNLPDLDFVIKRLLQNASDMGTAFKTYYDEKISAKFASLIRDHLVIAAQLVKAAKAGNTNAAQLEEKRWYTNASEIASFLNGINPNWSYNMVNEMLKQHLALTKSEAVYMITKDYASDVAVYDKIETQALEMADAFTNGIVKQFPNLF